MPLLPWFLWGKVKIRRTRQWLMWLGDCSLCLEGHGNGGMFLMTMESPASEMAHRLGDNGLDSSFAVKDLGILVDKKLCVLAAKRVACWTVLARL